MAGVDDPAFGEPDANFAVASFAQESQRTVDASSNGFILPPASSETNLEMFKKMLDLENQMYSKALESGEPPQNARAVLPTAVSTSLICEASLRALHHMAEVRLCTRTQGEYQDIFRLMRQRVYEVHPWAKGWLEVFCVNNGTCCFPRYDKCPIQGPLFNPETGVRYDKAGVVRGEGFDDYYLTRPAKRSEILEMWESNRHEAKPRAVDGKTM
jgi:hypothetical protein